LFDGFGGIWHGFEPRHAVERRDGPPTMGRGRICRRPSPINCSRCLASDGDVTSSGTAPLEAPLDWRSRDSSRSRDSPRRTRSSLNTRASSRPAIRLRALWEQPRPSSRPFHPYPSHLRVHYIVVYIFSSCHWIRQQRGTRVAAGSRYHFSTI